MEQLFATVNSFFDFIVPISDFLWDFPTNLGWYHAIPILGNFPLSVLVLFGSGIYFTIGTRCVQLRRFKESVKIVLDRKTSETGISPFAAFMLGTAMRAGPGNIVGVTGAISVGGPGALFWMYVSALFGMSLAFAEATLAQIFKEKKNDEFVGGLPYYGKKILGNHQWIGVALAVLFIAYALINLPSQTFHLFTAVGGAGDILTGVHHERTSPMYYGIGIVLIISIAVIVMGGLKRVVGFTNKVVPFMAVLYLSTALILILINIGTLPSVIVMVFKGAFSPEAIFGGMFGTVLQQGIRRGLMANEAGQGTITMAAAAADTDHPVKQGLVQSMGVFFDTMMICSVAGFMVIMARIWNLDPGQWDGIRDSKLEIFMTSVRHLTPGTMMDNAVSVIMCVCYALFAFTTLIGMIAFADICANIISRDKRFLLALRCVGAFFFIPFGVVTVLAGLELGNIWYIADLMNIIVVYANVPIILIGSKIVFKALRHYDQTGGDKGFVSLNDVGIASDYWTKERSSKKTAKA